MADWVIVVGVVAVIVAACLMFRPRKTLAGDMDAPINVEKQRARSEAAMAAPVSEADAEAAAPLVAFVEKISTDEFPDLAFDVDPLTAPLPAAHEQEDAALFNGVVAAAWFSQAWPTGPSVPFSSVQVVEPGPPEPFALEGPTGVFSKDWIEQVMAGGAR